MIVPIPINKASVNAIALNSIFPPKLQNRFFDNLFDRCNSFPQLVQPRLSKGYHSKLDGFSSQLDRARTDDDELAKLIGDFHHLVQTDSTLVAGVQTNVASPALVPVSYT